MRLPPALLPPLLVLCCAAALPAAHPEFAGPLSAGSLEAPPRQEASGLAASRRSPGVLWTHDDSKGAPVIYAVDSTGKRVGSLRVAGTRNEDWEDVAAFSREGKAWLLIGDIGDNDAKRDSIWLHVLEEPPLAKLNATADVDVTPAYSLRVRYEDGARDCEGVAVDAVEGAIYLLTKRDSPPRLYRVPLGPSREKHVTARFISFLPKLEGHTPVDAIFKHVAGKRAAWPTAFDISSDGRMAVVLTYGAPLVFFRSPKATWAETFKAAPERLMFHGQPQAEGVCFSADGRAIFLVSESSTALIRYEVRDR